MLEGLLKTMAEEPAKRKKVLIFYIRMVLSSIAASGIYTHFFGNYQLINFNDKNLFSLVFNFFVSGQIVVVGFLYLLCYFMLFEILSMIPPLALNYFTRGRTKKMQLDNGIIAGHLLLFNVIKRNKATREVTVGKNFDEYYYELLAYNESAAKVEVYNYKTSLLFEILTTYFIGVLVFYYFTVIDLPKILDWLFIVGLFFLAIFYINICYLENLFERNGLELITLLHTLKVEEIVNASLKQFGIVFSDDRKVPGEFFSKTITVNNTNKLLLYYSTRLDLSSKYINEAVRGCNQMQLTEIILLSGTDPTVKAEKLIQEHKEQLTFIKFITEDDLEVQLMKNLYDQ